jgi:LmbE family N-acetylglucosaminyl deacetylase
MTTFVTFHAHPDDEAIATGGTMALASDAGHRVVLVVATRGEHGEIVPGVLRDGEQLGVRRVRETYDAADVLGVHRVEFLGYTDSGMMGDDTNDHRGTFWQADLDHAANRLATILGEEGPEDVVFTIYDDHGGYGHPDHIQVHRVGRRAAEIAGVRRVFQSTINRDHILRSLQAMAEADGAGAVDIPDFESEPDFGSTEDVITHAVDVSGVLDRKRKAMEAHASQIAPDSFFLAMPPEGFQTGFGTEWYIELDQERPEGQELATDLFGACALPG